MRDDFKAALLDNVKVKGGLCAPSAPSPEPTSASH